MYFKIIYFYMYFKSYPFKTWYVSSVHCLPNFYKISISASFVMHVPDDGHKSSRNSRRNSYTYMHVLVALPYIIAQCTVMNYFTYNSNVTFHEAPLYYNQKYTLLSSAFCAFCTRTQDWKIYSCAAL
jgi:hypothetical protein